MSKKYRDLTPEEEATLRAFASEYGREWKQYLSAAWLSHAYKGRHMGGRDTGWLRQIRNDLGHEWLWQYRLAAPEAQATKAQRREVRHMRGQK